MYVQKHAYAIPHTQTGIIQDVCAVRMCHLTQISDQDTAVSDGVGEVKDNTV